MTILFEILGSINDNIHLYDLNTKNDILEYFPQINPEKIYVTSIEALKFSKIGDLEVISNAKKKYKIPQVDYIFQYSRASQKLNYTLKAFTHLISKIPM